MLDLKQVIKEKSGVSSKYMVGTRFSMNVDVRLSLQLSGANQAMNN